MQVSVVTPSPCLHVVSEIQGRRRGLTCRFRVMITKPVCLTTELSTPCLEKLLLKFLRLVSFPIGKRRGSFGVSLGLVCRAVDAYRLWGDCLG